MKSHGFDFFLLLFDNLDQMAMLYKLQSQFDIKLFSSNELAS